MNGMLVETVASSCTEAEAGLSRCCRRNVPPGFGVCPIARFVMARVATAAGSTRRVSRFNMWSVSWIAGRAFLYKILP
jgi:hypothetical protein